MANQAWLRDSKPQGLFDAGVHLVEVGVEMGEHIQFLIDALKPHAEELGITGTGA